MSAGLPPGGLGAGTQFTGFEAYNGGRRVFKLSAAMATAVQAVSASAGRICKIINTAGGSCSVNIWDSANDDSTSLSAAQVIWNQALPAGVLDLQVPLRVGLCVQAATTVANDVLITFV